MDASYVPNNPQFGLQLECNWTGNSSGLQQVSNCIDDLSSCWNEEMGSFSLPLDLDPLPSLFNISPCSNGTSGNYKISCSLWSSAQIENYLNRAEQNDVKRTQQIMAVLMVNVHSVSHGQTRSTNSNRYVYKSFK